jgi:hypothetical protein
MCLTKGLKINIIFKANLSLNGGKNYWQDTVECLIKNIKEEWKFVSDLLNPDGYYMVWSTKGNAILLFPLHTQTMQSSHTYASNPSI